MDIFYSYTYGTAGWFSLQAVPLLLSPKLIVNMLSTESRQPTDLETYFCRTLAITLLTLALVTILLTGSIPLSSTPRESGSFDNEVFDPKAPYAFPTITITATFHAASACYEYGQYMQTGNMCFALSMIGSGCLAATGLWCKLFADSSGKLSQRTGADKRTSGFPFSNAEANKRKAGKKRM